MTTWYKQGVFGKLIPPAANGLRLTERLYAQHGEDVFVTSIRDGTHMPGSFHPIGRAWDMQPRNVSKEAHKAALGSDFDVVDESDHRHVEYDPK